MKMMNQEEFDRKNIFGKGQPNTTYARYFVGKSYRNPLTAPGESPVSLANITFEPGARTFWHTHLASKGGGQILLCVAGSGWFQEEGKDAVSLEPGIVITILPGVKHWHGAKADSWFSHISEEIPGENLTTEWLGPVPDEEYGKLR